MLTACAIGCFFFGLLYGFVILSDTTGYRRYMLGLWKYETYFKVIMKILIYIISLIPALIILAITNFIVHDILWKYLLTCLGVGLAGFALACWAPILAENCKIIQLKTEQEANLDYDLD